MVINDHHHLINTSLDKSVNVVKTKIVNLCYIFEWISFGVEK